jgi:hypothetical protein
MFVSPLKAYGRSHSEMTMYMYTYSRYADDTLPCLAGRELVNPSLDLILRLNFYDFELQTNLAQICS